MIWEVRGRDGGTEQTIYVRCPHRKTAEAAGHRRGWTEVTTEPRFPNAVPPDAYILDLDDEAPSGAAALETSMIIQRPILTIVIGVVLGNFVWMVLLLIFGARFR